MLYPRDWSCCITSRGTDAMLLGGAKMMTARQVRHGKNDNVFDPLARIKHEDSSLALHVADVADSRDTNYPERFGGREIRYSFIPIIARGRITRLSV